MDETQKGIKLYVRNWTKLVRYTTGILFYDHLVELI